MAEWRNSKRPDGWRQSGAPEGYLEDGLQNFGGDVREEGGSG